MRLDRVTWCRVSVALLQKGDAIATHAILEAWPGELAGARQGSIRVCVQRVILICPIPLRPLYWRTLPAAAVPSVREQSGDLVIPPGTTLSFDTYFNSVFEQPWHLYTQAGAFVLDLAMKGVATLRIWRRTSNTGAILLHEQDVCGVTSITLADDTPHFRQSGLLWFELTAQAGPVVLNDANWFVTPLRMPEPVTLGVVICTFNRERELSAVLSSIADDRGIDEAVGRVIVVSQGRPDLVADPAISPVARRLGSRLKIVQQANLGGAGGFSRGLLEALDDPVITHACLLDDDVRLEPESLRRMTAFFSLARTDFAIGGHMLDSIDPTTLYEAGAVVRPNGALVPLKHALDLGEATTLDALLDVSSMHYNGWWMFALPKRLLHQVGMPLPCFIRGDDVEFGMRLQQSDIPTIGLPGVGIWHEPFYLKIGGWQLYYETRNGLICSALHQDFVPRRVAIVMLKRLLVHLLTYRYYSAALIVRGIEDFCRGPAILDQDPRPLHAGLAELRAADPDLWTPRERVLSEAPVGRSPRSRMGFVFVMVCILARNWIWPTTPAATLQLLDIRNLVWFRIARLDTLAVETYWDRNFPTFRRDRARFRTLFGSGLRAIWRLRRQAPRLRQDWQDNVSRLTDAPFWRGYVRYGEKEAPPAE